MAHLTPHDLRRFRATTRQLGRGCSGLGVTLAVLAATGAHAAETHFSPYAQSLIDYDSNVFRVDSNADVPIVDGKQIRDDEVFSNILGANASYQFGQQTLRANLEGRRYDHLQITSLNHFEYTVGGAFDYRILDRVGGTLDYTESRRQSTFVDRNSTQLATQLNFDRDQNGGATTKFLVLDDWAADGGYHLHVLNTPVIGAPSLKLTENYSNAGLSYVGISRASIGLSGTYSNGNYSGASDVTRFRQYTGAGVFSYEASELSQYVLRAGYSERKDVGLSKTSGFTGELTLRRELTAKTRTELRAFRRIASYTAGDNTVIESGLSSETRWRPTTKLEFELTYDYTHVAFQNTGLPGVIDQQGRKDIFRASGLRIIYQALDWLEVSNTNFYTVRRSSLPNNDFNAATFGLSIRATFKNGNGAGGG